MEVVFYERQNGERPAEDFLLSLDVKMRAKMAMTIRALESFGSELRMPYSEYLEDGILQLRAKSGSDITRVLYFFFDGDRAVLTNGFVKKTPKTPPRELELAKKYRADYFDREAHA